MRSTTSSAPALLPESVDVRPAVAGLIAIMRDVSVPFGAPYTEFGVYNTEYRTVVDLTYRLYFSSCRPARM